jgi:uncharacterized membrane protein
VAAIGLVYFIWMFLITWLRHRAWFSETSDIGIFNQAIWLLAHGHEPFASVRAINIFGDHASLNLLLLAPFYRLWPGDGVTFLYFVQAAAVGSTVVPLYRLVRHAGGRPGIGLAVCAAFAVSPLVQNSNYEFHPEALATPLLIWALLAAHEERWVLFGIAAGLAALAKEDIPMIVVFIGLWLLLVQRRRTPALWAMAGGLALFVFDTRILIPRSAGGIYLYYQRFKEYGSGMFSVLFGLVRHFPSVLTSVFGSHGLPYLAILLACLGPLVVLEPGLLIPTVPTIAVNLLSNFSAQRNIENHYILPALPFLIAAVAFSAGRLDRAAESAHLDRGTRRRVIGLVAAAALVPALATNWLFSSAQPDRPGFRPVVRRSAHSVRLDQAAALIPPDASVSASYYLTPHVSGRRVVYLFPEPFANPPDQFPRYVWADKIKRLDEIQYVFVDRNDVYYDQHHLFGLLPNAPGETWDTLARYWYGFTPIYDADGILVLRRGPPPSTSG